MTTISRYLALLALVWPCEAVSRRQLVRIAGALSVGSCAPRSWAFCGAPYPRWAYFLDWEETLAPVLLPGTESPQGMYVRCLGNKKEERKAQMNPVLVIPGGPGLPHDYLETLEGVANSPRRVIDFDPLFTGKSAEYVQLTLKEASKPPEGLIADFKDLSDAQRRYLESSAGQAAQASTAGTTFLQKENKGAHVITHGAFGAAAGLALLLESLRSPGQGPSPLPILSLTLTSPLARSGGSYVDGVPTKASNFVCVESAMQGSVALNAVSGQSELLKMLDSVQEKALLVKQADIPALVTLTSSEMEAQELGMSELERRLGSIFNRLETQTYTGADELVHLTRRDDFVGNLVKFLDAADQ